jgi:hypothetical protein
MCEQRSASATSPESERRHHLRTKKRVSPESERRHHLRARPAPRGRPRGGGAWAAAPATETGGGGWALSRPSTLVVFMRLLPSSLLFYFWFSSLLFYFWFSNASMLLSRTPMHRSSSLAGAATCRRATES